MHQSPAIQDGGDSLVPQADTELGRETFRLAALGTSAAQARRRTMAWLTRHGVAPDPVATAVLIASELVANAVVHGGGDVINCVLQLSGGLLRIEVTDHGTGRDAPAVKHAAVEEASGRGLLLVSEVSEAWGVARAVPSGWTVWATVRTTVLNLASRVAVWVNTVVLTRASAARPAAGSGRTRPATPPC